MDLFEVLEQVQEQLRRRGRLTCRMLQAQFKLDENDLEALKEELIEGQQVAADEGGKVLVWRGTSAGVSSTRQPTSPSPVAAPSAMPAAAVHSVPEAERRQLTVMFCDLVGSTQLS